MSVVGATVDAFKAHPVIWGGVLVGAIAIVWLASRGSSSSAEPQQFTFGYGPSDAQVAAGTALQIAQVQANAYSASAAANNATATTVAQDYFGYLANNSANGLTAQQDALATAATINGQNVGGASYAAGLNLQGLLNTNATQQAIASNNNSTQLAALINTNQTAWNTTQNNNLVALNTNATNLAAVQSNNATALAAVTSNNNTAWATVQNNNGTALAEQAASINGSLQAQSVAGQQQIATIGAEQPYVMAQLASNERLTANAQAIAGQSNQLSALVSATQAGDQVSVAQAQAGAAKSSSGIGQWISGAAGVLGLASLL